MTQPVMAQVQQQRLQMVLAPQLRQSLHLLQVPLLELQSLLQQEMEQNPTLEERIEARDPVDIEPGLSQDPADGAESDEEDYRALAEIDTEWRDYFRMLSSARPRSSDEESRREYFLNTLTQPESLQQHLLGQLSLAAGSEEDRKIGELLIGSIDDDGYLTSSIEDLAASAGYDVEPLRRGLAMIREFDPIGVGAGDLRECLLLQLKRLGKDDSLAALLVREHLESLGKRRYPELARALKRTVEEVQESARFIATLEPRPGRLFSADRVNYVLPEVGVQKVDGEYVVQMNDEQLPHLMISTHYRKLMEDPSTPAETREYIREKIRGGAFLIKSIHQRQDTIRRIAREIVRIQRDFLDKGVAHLKPLTMAQVAALLGLHETTVSRAIAGKYLQTPRGVFELKYFFTPALKTAAGEEVSNKTIQDALAQMVAEEDPRRPLSDAAMVRRLEGRGLRVARRTVAKYRDALNILPSHLRKRY